MNQRMILPTFRLDVEFEDGSKMAGRVRQIILAGKKIKVLEWHGIPVPVDALKYLDDGLVYVVNVP